MIDIKHKFNCQKNMAKKRKLSIARNNQSKETKEKISASIKEVWAKRKLDKELS